MSASLAQERRLEDGAIAPTPGLLLSLATIALVSFDRVLFGMVRAGQGIEALCRFLGLTPAVLDGHLVRLGLPTPHDRPLRRPGPKGWSEADARRVIAWRLVGVHPEVIGQRLERLRSANAVRAKARRLGLEAPPRKALQRPPPETLCDPAPGALFHAQAPTRVDICGTGAGQVSVARASNDGAGAPHPSVTPLAEPAGEIAPNPECGRKARPADQRELPIFNAVGNEAALRGLGSAVPPIVVNTPCTKPASRSPSHEGEVDLSGDLSWFAHLTRPRTNRAAVWVAFALMAGGLNYKAAAARLGVTPSKFATFRYRAKVPVDYDRKKANDTFDAEAARVTLERSGFILKRATVSDDIPKARAAWFWVHRREAARVTLSPTKRPREKIPGMPRSDTYTIITRAMLDAEPWKFRVPFAGARATVCA